MNEKRFHILFLGGSRQIRIVDRETTVVAIVDVYDDKIQYFVDKLNEQDKKIRELESKQHKKMGGWHNAKEYFEKIEEGDERKQD